MGERDSWQRIALAVGFVFALRAGPLACATDEFDEHNGARAEANGSDAGGAAPVTPIGSDGSNVPTSASDAGTAPQEAGPTRVPVFIAQGKLGRTTISCDDGRTWIADHSENPSGRCWDDTSPNNVECDHNSWSSLGMVEANGAFLATYGWGYPGVVRRTEDGIHWDDVLPGHTFAGMAFGNGRVVANDHTPMISMSGGAAGSWNPSTAIPSTGWTVRSIAFIADGGGRFVITLEGEVLLSDDNGATWRSAASVPTDCAKAVRRTMHGGGTTVMFQNDGSVCRSSDRGDHWERVAVTDSFSSTPLFVDGKFTIWTGSTRWQSADGAQWASTPGTPGVTIGAVARGDSGTYVAVRDGWQVYYEKQQFYRSTDGVSWDVLPQTAFNPSHPITHVIAGWAKPSVECPLH